MSWRYKQPDHPESEEVAKRTTATRWRISTIKMALCWRKGQLLNSFALLRDDGSTASSCWIYTGSWTEQGNQMANRDNADPSGLGNTQDGPGVAAQSSGAVQPRFGRYQRQALGCEADADPVERQQVGRE